MNSLSPFIKYIFIFIKGTNCWRYSFTLACQYEAIKFTTWFVLKNMKLNLSDFTLKLDIFYKKKSKMYLKSLK